MQLDQEITETLTCLPSWVLGDLGKIKKLRRVGGVKSIIQVVVGPDGGEKISAEDLFIHFCSNQELFLSRALMKLIDISLFLPFVIV